GTATAISSTWQQFTTVLTPGDWNKDGKADLIALTTAGNLILYLGNGAGAFANNGVQIGSSWYFRAILTPGDFNGDGNPDLIAVTTAGAAVLYPGDGGQGWGSSFPQIATGWSSYTAFAAGGDFSGDGKSDVLAVATDGTLKVLAGSGTGAISATGAAIGSGWGSLKAILSPGKFSGPGNSDLLSITT